MSELVVTDEKGRLSLPETFWAALDLKRPAQFRAELKGERIELTPIDGEEEIAELRQENGFLVISTGGKPFDAVEAIRAVREERQ
jgi:hypothetical protein